MAIGARFPHLLWIGSGALGAGALLLLLGGGGMYAAIHRRIDEGTTAAGGGGHVAALALAPLVEPHWVLRATTNHYGLLQTIEAAWSLPALGRSAGASPIEGIWR